MSKHTPGPWTGTEEYDGTWYVDAGNEEVAVTWTGPDARLIAAAPEMYELLREVLAYGVARFNQRIRDLSAKIEGDK